MPGRLGIPEEGSVSPQRVKVLGGLGLGSGALWGGARTGPWDRHAGRAQGPRGRDPKAKWGRGALGGGVSASREAPGARGRVGVWVSGGGACRRPGAASLRGAGVPSSSPRRPAPRPPSLPALTAGRAGAGAGWRRRPGRPGRSCSGRGCPRRGSPHTGGGTRPAARPAAPP